MYITMWESLMVHTKLMYITMIFPFKIGTIMAINKMVHDTGIL